MLVNKNPDKFLVQAVLPSTFRSEPEMPVSKNFCKKLAIIVACGAVIGLAWLALLHKPQKISLISWSSSFDLSSLTANRSEIDLVQRDGRWVALMKTPDDVDFSGVSVDWPSASRWNPQDYQWVGVDVTNVGDLPCEVGLKVDCSVPMPDQNLSNRVCLVMPGETGRARASLFSTPYTYDQQPSTKAMAVAPGQSLVPQAGRISSIRIYVRQKQYPAEHQIEIGEIQLESPVQLRSAKNFLPVVDRFGQLKADRWPGKIDSEAQLVANAEVERANFESGGRSKSWSKYGGWLDGPRMDASGFFRTEKIDDQWWLVDPEGYLFWSHGVDSVSSAFSGTGTQDREDHFEWLPPNNIRTASISDLDPLGGFYYQANWANRGFYKDRVPYWSYNFLIANLHRQFGSKWHQSFQQLAHQRLHAWRMNTMAAWSDPKVTAIRKTAYAEFVRISDCRYIEGSRGSWQKFIDVFAPEFEDAVVKALQTRDAAFDDPWCIGFFVDNELPWGDDCGLADGVIRSPAAQPAKEQWINFLQQKYSAVEDLNKQWRTEFENWDEVRGNQQLPQNSREQDLTYADRKRFSQVVTDRYFSVIANKLKLFAPDRLYLGCRFFWKNDEVLKVAAKYCDVVSINNYHFLATHVSLPEGVDKPILIGEFHFGATDRGMLHPTNLPTDNQADRAAKYKGYVESALQNPAIVGTHWFQYVDNPVTGRGDETNSNVGLITITNQPYPELVEAITKVGETMYEVRSKSGTAASEAMDNFVSKLEAAK